MRCLSPKTVGRLSDGKTLCWSPKHYCKEFATFQLPCGKCIECRLGYARDAAIRCVHEADMHDASAFITLTYSDKNLKSNKLNYEDFQLFMKRLREKYLEFENIGYFVTGEYGEKTKRPHWHALLFNWWPSDRSVLRKNELGDQLYQSSTLDSVWGKNDPDKCPSQIGSVTIDSAGYCARYAAKKLVHGLDQLHNYQPIHKRSCKNAIGKKWIEKYFEQTFAHGYITLLDSNGPQKLAIPRYYTRWLQKNHPLMWNHYVTHTKQKFVEYSSKISEHKKNQMIEFNLRRAAQGKQNLVSDEKVRETIITQKFKRLQSHLKGDL